MEFSREDVEFLSHGAVLRGWLYRPAGVSSSPAVVMAHGFTAVREMFLDRYAEAFAAAGFASLVYDHYGFGASEGEPRQYPAVSLQLDGYRDAIRWIRRQPAVDAERIGIWGSSYSGGHVIMLAAEDLPIRCGVAQVPGIGAGGPAPSDSTVAAVARALEAGRPHDTVPAVSATETGMGIMFEDGAHEWFTRVARERAPSWRDEVQVGALAEPARPVDHLPRVKVPLLLIVAPQDRLTPPAEAVRAAAALPLVEIAEIPGGHFDAYEAGFAASSERAIAWFQRFLSG